MIFFSTSSKLKQNSANSTMQNKRIDSLDWLRGLMALSIMVYHLTGWYFYHPDASVFLGRMGIYGVSIFFILSGLSMAIVYNHYITSTQSAFFFFIRRIFRIWPLLWIATFLTIIISSNTPSFTKIFLNLTGLFGFVPPYAYIATGAWSIGNEMVYYALTPIFLWTYNKKIGLGNLLFAVTVIIGLYFSSILMTPIKTLPDQWGIYIHPFNNLFLYTAGIAIYYNLRNIKIQQGLNLVILLSCAMAFIFFPIEGNQIIAVTGWNRIIFVMLSIGLVVGFYKFTLNITNIIAYPLEKLGIVTYGVYILHPLIKIATNKAFSIIGVNNKSVIFTVIIINTIIISLISYYSLELRMMRFGKKITVKNK